MKVIFFLIVALLVAFSFTLSKKIKSGRDFLVPKDGMPFVVVAFTMAATQFGSSMLIGGVQQAQQQPAGQGFYPAMYTLLAAAVSCFVNMFISPRYKDYGELVTPPDFIETRYGKSRFMRCYHSLAYICSITCVLVSQFVGFASMSTAAGFSYQFSIVLCAVVVCLLALGSGMLGVAVTDMIQFAAIMLLLLVSCVFSLDKLSGVGISFSACASEAFFPSAAMKSKFWYTVLPMLIGNLFSYEYFMRFMSCRGVKAARKASVTAGIILLITAIPVGLLGAVANYFYQGADSVTVFGQIINSDMPRWFGYFMILVVLMAVLTSADSLLTSISGIVTKDIYAGLLNPRTQIDGLPHLRSVERGAVVGAASVAAIFALFYKQILSITFFFSPLTSGTMFAPMIIGLFWKGANKKGAECAVICAAAAGILHLTGVITLFDRVAGPAAVGTAALIIFSLIFRDRSKSECLKGA